MVFIFAWIHAPFEKGKGTKAANSHPNNENDQFPDAEQRETLDQDPPQIAEKTKYCHIQV